MNEKDAAVIKTLAELGLRKEEPLTPEQEQLLKRALDPYEEFLAQVEQLFCEQNEFDRQSTDLETMFRTQRLRCHEFRTYVEQVLPTNVQIGSYDGRVMQYMPVFVVAAERGKWLSAARQFLSVQQADKLLAKFDRMVKAKRVFQEHGGDYEVFELLDK